MSEAETCPIEVRLADLQDAHDQSDVLHLLDYYAQHTMGQGKALPEDVRKLLLKGLLSHPTSLVFLARRDRQAVGVATCFIGFSTFQARQLINIHDLVVAEPYQQAGIGSAILDAVCAHAKLADYCAVTLEVLAGNPARKLYIKKGFEGLADAVGNETMLFGKRPI